jgi:Uma2 family endonuclease
VTAAETGYIVHTNEAGTATILAPDVGFIAKARVPREPVRSYLHLAPDLAVEVVSPNDSASEIHVKVNKYLQYGTRAVWVAYPETHTVAVHTASGAKTLTESETLDGGDILPGFTLPVREIFS